MASDVVSPDISGSSAADTDIPKRLTGSVYNSWALANPVTAPVGNSVASIVSMYALICTAPRLTHTGAKLCMTSRTGAKAAPTLHRKCGATLKTTGTCTAHCNALPTTDPHASMTARLARSLRPPNHHRLVIIAAFHTIGAVYDRRKRR